MLKLLSMSSKQCILGQSDVDVDLCNFFPTDWPLERTCGPLKRILPQTGGLLEQNLCQSIGLPNIEESVTFCPYDYNISALWNYYYYFFIYILTFAFLLACKGKVTKIRGGGNPSQKKNSWVICLFTSPLFFHLVCVHFLTLVKSFLNLYLTKPCCHTWT